MSTTFTELGVPQDLVDVLAASGVSTPFPIQASTIADAMDGRDVCGRAPTGSGKTLAFSIPIAAMVAKSAPGRPHALILVPTRELAAQVCAELRPLAQRRGRTVAAFYGGTPIAEHQRRLRRGVDVVVACPGRLADLVARRQVSLAQVRIVVIDEADRMADMGFLPEVQRLLDQTTADRQTLLFSATLDGDVDVLVRRYQRNPVRHEHEADEESCGDVRHLFWHAAATDRMRIVADVVNLAAPAIVFTRTKHAADRLARQLEHHGVKAVAIHGNRSQSQRDRALGAFVSGRATTLVATDVAARGIHVADVGVVVHYDPPATDKDYVHRSGRTGRAGASGVVVTLVSPDKLRAVESLQRALALPRGVAAVALEQLDGSLPVPVPVSAPAARPGPGRVEDPRRRRGGSSTRTAPTRRRRRPTRP